MEKTSYHKRLNDFERFDKITLEVVPRYKTSGLSGDEWRQHVEIKFWFKGVQVANDGYSDMESAIMFLGSRLIQHREGQAVDEKQAQARIALLCDQPSCANVATTKYRLKRETASDGHYLADEEMKYHEAYRQFCSVHAKRGDCSREDSDDNYEVIEGHGPIGSTNVQESPSRLG